jgi:hypothetical protein
MSYVVAGSRLTWSGDFDSFAFISQTSGDTIQIVGSALSNKYNMLIERSANVGDWTGLGAKTITLDLRTDMDRNSDDDIRSNVADEFAAAGSACSASRITSITPPGGQAQQTGAPTAPPSTVNTGGGAGGGTAPKGCTGFWDCLSSGEFSNAFGNITNSIEAGSIGFIVGGIAVVGLIIFLALKEPA